MLNEREVHLLGNWEVAELLGWPPNKVATYFNKRVAGMPEPLVRLHCGPVWRKQDIIAWAEAAGYTNPRPRLR